MKKLNTTPISGTQEFLPATQATFDLLKDQIADTYRRHGFMQIETPAIDRMEILLAKAGGETEKQIYKVVKTAESGQDADQALRFDHTVPLARYVVEHENNLTFPFKVSQIGRNWRGERAQKGRFREFYQCDVDVVGRGKLALAYDADVIATLMDAIGTFKLTTPVVARVSNRKILNGFLATMGLSDQATEISRIIDHAEKITPDEVRLALRELGLDAEQITRIFQFITIAGPSSEAKLALDKLEIHDETFETGVNELMQVLQLLEVDGLGDKVIADMKIVRGLDYYTGTVFELFLPEHREVGSVGGGGRYDNLASYFTDQTLPGVGGSIGLSRLFYALNEHNLLQQQIGKPIDTAVIPIGETEIPFALKVARELRAQGQNVTVVYLDKKLGERLAYAARIAKNAVVIGEDEVRSGQYQIKHFD